VLTGNFIKAGHGLRVTAQLVATGTGEILWCDKIDVAERDLSLFRTRLPSASSKDCS
jgi:TolB-like protein